MENERLQNAEMVMYLDFHKTESKFQRTKASESDRLVTFQNDLAVILNPTRFQFSLQCFLYYV